ncbi:hypothetical protein WICPIJ_006587 [Wickerhamomyces pijperi]|uniref:Actin cytoskeleton-regulatory complex protein END3 n=1 Tax=Wickerhamomyces pijperi TaxID=599730 RepID=A0A9P8TKV9_WICPI|nr:hypothetical protein WICPIJ_006587 [Wickerhamomyces pijperi]
MSQKIEEWEIKKYWEIFSGLKPTNNKLSGSQVSPILKNSKLSDDKLSQIWSLSDIDNDGSLDFEEFCICMRCVFDLVNGNIQSLPSQLPDWLVPASKSHLVQANHAVTTSSNNNSSSGRYSDSEDEESFGPESQFDWYISPNDKSTYESIYSQACDRFGRITFDSLTQLYATLKNVADTDARSAWNLVNPRSSETIDKDQTLVFLHMLNQREAGKQMPRGVPGNLRATFSKEAPEYSLDSHQANITASKPANSKQAFGANYLGRIGDSSKNTKGTDFSVTKDTDWETVRLKRELTDLETEISKLEQQNEQKAKERSSVLNGTGTTTNKTLLIRREFEQLLKYKQAQLIESGKQSTDLSSVEDDIRTVESQVEGLKEYLERKKNELLGLEAEIQRARS